MTPPPPLDVRSLRKQLNPGGMNSAHLMLGFSLVSQNITALGWVVSKRCASSALFPAAPLQMTISVLQLFFLDRRKSSVWSWFVLCGWLVLVLQRELALLGSLRGPTRWTSGVSEELLDETLVFCSGAGWGWGGGGGGGVGMGGGGGGGGGGKWSRLFRGGRKTGSGEALVGQGLVHVGQVKMKWVKT